MASGSGFGSNNPFRRKSSNSTGGGAAPPRVPEGDHDALDIRPPLTSTLTSVDDFQRSLQALPKSEAPPPSTTFLKKKPVKKVRVQSPPPSSPESASAEHTYPRYPLPPREDDDDSSISSQSINGEKEDPFQNEAPPSISSLRYDEPDDSTEPPTQPGRVPPNPFGKTLEDVEHGTREGDQTEAGLASPTGKAALDVDAFRRLLLTGQANTPGTAPSLSSSTSTPTPSSAHPHPTGVAGDGASITDTSSISRQFLFDAAHPLQETPRTSHEISEPKVDEEKQGLISSPQIKRQISRKKPPPPPSSRHGKSVKAEPKEPPRESFALEHSGSAGRESISPASPRSPSDINKPLPPPPSKLEDDVKESIFDKEAAGKVPEVDIDPEADVVPLPRPPTPPNASHSASTPVQNPSSALRKPAPPPRRQQHARTNSKAPSVTGVSSSSHLPSEYAEDVTGTPPRSSFESNLSRSSSMRLSFAGPAPPPPRRATYGHKASPSVTSPTGASYSPSFPFPSGPASPGSEADRSSAGFTSTHPTHSQPYLADGPSPSGSSSTSIHQTPSSSNLPPSAFPKSPPPPPPARNSSVRKGVSRNISGGSNSGRPSSVHDVEPSTRKIGREGAPPPPPPPRARGSSRGSTDLPGIGSRRTSTESVKNYGDTRADPGGSSVAPLDEEQDGELLDTSGQSMDVILADLVALQREVDEARARAQCEKGGV